MSDQSMLSVLPDGVESLRQRSPQSGIVEDEPAPTRATKDWAFEVRRFIDGFVIPNEPALGMEEHGKDDAASAQMLSDLAVKARATGLWGLFYPASLGGKIASLEDYVAVAEEEGRSEFGPAIFGSEAIADVYVMNKYGNAEIRSRFLAPTVSGDAVPSYGMSEPDSIGSSPATIKTSALLADGVWTVNGRKWFVCRSDRGAFITVVAKTDAGAPLDRALSMIVVPANSRGVAAERPLDIFGRFQGQREISFSDVEVPEQNLLGERNRGLDLVRQRLGLGRMLRSAQWVGLAQRCLDLMCGRICSERGELARLSEKQLIRLHVFEAHKAIVSARALVRLAARGFDSHSPSDIDIMTAKVAASGALGKAADSAVQIFGAEGVSCLTPLSGIYRTARATRFMDGTDEALVNATGRDIIASWTNGRRQ